MKKRIKYALEKYKKGEFSFGQVADFTGLSVWDIPELFKKYKVNINYDSDELKMDLNFLG
jgi:predicted HTH domain antitoxin